MTSISILGIYVADLVFFADKIPAQGESVLGQEHVIGPGGKGSNQAVAAAKAGGKVNFISKIGNDQYGEMALQCTKNQTLITSNVIISKESLQQELLVFSSIKKQVKMLLLWFQVQQEK